MYRLIFAPVLIFAVISLFSHAAFAQKENSVEVISDREQLEQIVPASFYFAGLSGATQRRNSTVAKFGDKRFIVAGLVDTSGYSTEISGVYEGFFITDSKVKFGSKKLDVGAYGFGFAQDGTVNIFDLSAKKILSVKTVKDEEMARPRPLMMISDTAGVRLYKGRDYVVIRPR